MNATTELTNPRLEIGGNNPPPSALESALILTIRANAWLLGCPEITDADAAREAGEMVEKLRATKKNLAAALKVDLAPHDQAIADVKAQYREPASKIDAALSDVLARSSAWLVKERARIAAEKAAQEAEARWLREEAERLERERIEAARKADDERRRLVEAEEASAADIARVEAERQEAIEASERAVEAARTAKTAERAAEKKIEVAAIKSEPARRAMTLRTYWSAVVVDEAAAIDSYRDHPTVRKAALAAALQVANEAARTEKREDAAPAGFRFVKEERAS